jgi:D-3-phosphoglycerate dehydrogenase
VVNSPEGNTIAAAEQTLALSMSLSRNTPQAFCSLREGKWERSKFMGVELYNKTLGVIGLGKIGSRLATYGMALGMNVIGYDPFVSQEHAKKIGLTLKSLDEVIRESDYITLHVPKNQETWHLINKERIAQMKKGVRLINCARGGIIDEVALLEGIVSGQVAGAALDVFEKEPPEADSPLLKNEKIIVTPHLGASTVEAQVNVAVDVAEQIAEVLKGGQAKAAVNIPSMRPDILAPVKPFLGLAEKLGSLISQIVEGPIKSVEISYFGEVATNEVAPLTVAVLKGLFEPIIQESVNFVNATLIAKERDIKVTELKDTELSDFVNLISVKVTTEKETREVAGSLFGTFGPRIVRIDGFRVNAEPAGYLLVVPNVDRPGMIGKIGTLLGEHKINIASMDVGRESVGGQAVMVINIDNPVPKEILERIRKIDGISGPPKSVRL